LPQAKNFLQFGHGKLLFLEDEEETQPGGIGQ
jgi:hypothetical protein